MKKIPRMKRLACLTTLGAAVVAASSVAVVTAQTKSVSPADAAWSIQLDLPKLLNSRIGKQIVDRVQDQRDDHSRIDRLSQTLGLDITKDIGPATLYGDGFKPEAGTLVVQLGDNTGNLEGWMLTLPGYDSASLDDNTLLHSFEMHRKPPPHRGDAPGPNGRPTPPPPPGPRVWAALPKASDGHFVLIASRDHGRTVGLAEQVLSGDTSLTMDKDNALAGSTVMKLQVKDLSDAALPPDRPGSAIAKSIQDLSLTLDSADALDLSLSMTADTAARARQLVQLIQGGVAMLQYGVEQRPEAAPLAGMLDKLKMRHQDGSEQVSASLNISADQVNSLVDMALRHAHPGPPRGDQARRDREGRPRDREDHGRRPERRPDRP